MPCQQIERCRATTKLAPTLLSTPTHKLENREKRKVKKLVSIQFNNFDSCCCFLHMRDLPGSLAAEHHRNGRASTLPRRSTIGAVSPMPPNVVNQSNMVATIASKRSDARSPNEETNGVAILSGSHPT